MTGGFAAGVWAEGFASEQTEQTGSLQTPWHPAHWVTIPPQSVHSIMLAWSVPASWRSIPDDAGFQAP
jgi:hypothetical protein